MHIENDHHITHITIAELSISLQNTQTHFRAVFAHPIHTYTALTVSPFLPLVSPLFPPFLDSQIAIVQRRLPPPVPTAHQPTDHPPLEQNTK